MKCEEELPRIPIFYARILMPNKNYTMVAEARITVHFLNCYGLIVETENISKNKNICEWNRQFFL